MDLTPVPQDQRGSLSTGVRWTIRPRLDSDGRYGRIQAIDLNTRKTLWTERQRAPQTTGVLATAGGLVFAGALDRGFTAYDDATGKTLWHAKLSDVPSSAPISYAVDGKQYVAMTVGYGSAHALTFPMLTPEIDLPSCAARRFGCSRCRTAEDQRPGNDSKRDETTQRAAGAGHGIGEGGGAIVAGSQCSSALPLTKRHVSNHVVE